MQVKHYGRTTKVLSLYAVLKGQVTLSYSFNKQQVRIELEQRVASRGSGEKNF